MQYELIQYLNLWRTHKESLVRLRKLLSDSSKHIRHRRHLINIHIAALGWLTEFTGFFIVFLGSFILGHKNSVVTLILQSLSMFIFYNILPCIYLVNDSDLKADVAETQVYFKFLQIFKWERVDPRFLKKGEEDTEKAVEPNLENVTESTINYSS